MIKSKYTIEDAKKMAKERGGECLSEEYPNYKTRLKWRCHLGHEWESTLNNVKRGSWCRKCGWINGAADRKGRKACKNTLETMISMAESRGGKCLSKKYVNSQTNLEWECKCGHTWFAMPSNVKSGTWCPKCAPIKMGLKRRENIESIKLLAKKNDCELISKEYNNAFETLKWKCHKDHVFFKSVHEAKSGKWCPICSWEKVASAKRFDIKKAEELAKKRGGKCISDKYINANEKLLWECKHGHRWETIYNAVYRGTWCPYCNTQSKKEKIFRYVIETMLEIEFKKSRPPWLLNPKTGRRMEIDGYNEDNAICFEYQGRQHFIHIPYIHRKYELFLNAQERDVVKKKLLNQNKIFILYPDYKIKPSDFPYFIENKLDNTKFKKMIKNSAKTIDINIGFSL